jgi:multidrug efflux pump subunit AcrA (membrane-fusion protein)
MLDVFAAHEIPIDLGVIPNLLSDTLARNLQARLVATHRGLALHEHRLSRPDNEAAGELIVDATARKAGSLCTKASAESPAALNFSLDELQSHGAQAASDSEIAQSNYKLAHSALQALDAQIKQARAELGTAEANLAYTRITAPMNGEVVSISALEGQTLNATQQAPTILRIAELNTMTVWALVRFRWIKLGREPRSDNELLDHATSGPSPQFAARRISFSAANSLKLIGRPVTG